MARRKNNIPNGPGLFHEQEQQERHLTRRIRRQRALFIPRFLRDASTIVHLLGAAQDRAHEIALDWANLESDGHFYKHNETSIDTQFLDQLFGEGLGYRVKTASPESWQLEHKFTVPGVGTADASIQKSRQSRRQVAFSRLRKEFHDAPSESVDVSGLAFPDG